MRKNFNTITEIKDSRLLFGIVLRCLSIYGAVSRTELYSKVKENIKKIFPSMLPDYFFKRFNAKDSPDLIFTTIFCFAILYLRDKGYYLIKQHIRDTEQIISLTHIGKKFLEQIDKEIEDIHYTDIENFLYIYYPDILEKNSPYIKYFQRELARKFLEDVKLELVNKSITQVIFGYMFSKYFMIIYFLGFIVILIKFFKTYFFF